MLRPPKIRSWLHGLLVSLALAIPVSAEQQDAAQAIQPLDCVINPSVVADLGSSVPGILHNVTVDRSDFIQAGDVVAELESGLEVASLDLARERAEMTAEVDLRRVNAAFGRRQHKRSKDLFLKKAISTNDMDERETESRLSNLQLRQALDNQKLAQLELVRAQEVVKRRSIQSPISGVVMERFKSIGEYIEDQPVVRVAQLDPLHIEVIVPVEQLGKVRPGMQAKVWSDAVTEQEWMATVSRVDRVADVASGTYGVRLTLDNPDYVIPAGLRCRLAFDESTPAPVAVQSEIEPAPAAAEPTQTPLSDTPEQEMADDDVPAESADMVQAALEVEPVQAVAEPAQAAVSETPAQDPTDQVTTKNDVPVESTDVDQAAVEPEVVNDAAPSVMDLPSSQARICQVIGPYAYATSARAAADRLQADGFEVKVEQRRVSVPVGFRVLSRRLDNQAEADRLKSRLKAAGIKDYFLSKKTAFPARISLGLYKGPKSLKRRVADLEGKGFAVEAVTWRKSTRQFFLAAAGDAQADERLVGLPRPDAVIAREAPICRPSFAAHDNALAAARQFAAPSID